MRAMRRAVGLLARFGRAEAGATAIEYALIAAGMSIVIASTVYGIAGNLRTNFYDKLNSATTN